MKESKAMSTSPSPARFTARLPMASQTRVKKAVEFQSLAQLVEDLIPNFRKEEDRQFYREVVQSYRAAAARILRQV
jgi:hypothetical protein